ncbi:hypothetical protein ABT269_16170 [Streptomyces viridosporus]|uniref:AbiTii domain-containing protein n=1 Tax=Streptomyces viridosporus TaxID=67581 RepID=UPI0033286335
MSRRGEALALSEELLSDIELSRIPAQDIARKASRLARLIDDFDAIEWLSYEISGYPSKGLDSRAAAAAKRSNRETVNDEGEVAYWTATLSRFQAAVDLGKAQIAASVDAPVHITSVNPQQYVVAPTGNAQERALARNNAADSQERLDKVVGAMHQWVSDIHYELRFGAAVEDAFSVVRSSVDGKIAALVPDAVLRLSSAFERSVSDNPEDWAGAASTCRRLIKSVADALRPPGDPVGTRKMTDAHFINRLMDWIVNRPGLSDTQRDVIVGDLEYLGRRLDAFADAGNKGAHADVTRYEASRYITGTYLFLGDILMLHDVRESAETDPA